MHEVTTVQDGIAIVGTVAAIVCFIVYILITTNVITPDSNDQLKQNSDEALNQARSLTGPTSADIASVIQSLAALSQALAKAGPALWSLIASILFLFVASVASGAISGGTSSNSSAKATEAAPRGDAVPAGNGQSPSIPGKH